MKTERVTLLTTPEFKKFLGNEAAREGKSVAELVRSRCEHRPDANEALLLTLAGELRSSVREAQRSLESGLTEAKFVLAELREQREKDATHKQKVPPAARVRRKRRAA